MNKLDTAPARTLEHPKASTQIIWNLSQMAPDSKATKSSIWVDDTCIYNSEKSLESLQELFSHIQMQSSVKVQVFSNHKTMTLEEHFTFEGVVNNRDETTMRIMLTGEIVSGDLILRADLHTRIGKFYKLH